MTVHYANGRGSHLWSCSASEKRAEWSKDAALLQSITKNQQLACVSAKRSPVFLVDEACLLRPCSYVYYTSRLGSAYADGMRNGDWLKIKRRGAIPPQRFQR
jgi:hypothetical protein